MATMNWEKLHTLRHGSAFAYDELPRTGSYQDRARFFSNNASRDSCPRKQHTSSPSTTRGAAASLFEKKIHGITLYVKYMESVGFANRPSNERSQIISSLRAAVKKVLASDDGHLYRQMSVIHKAARLCSIAL